MTNLPIDPRPIPAPPRFVLSTPRPAPGPVGAFTTADVIFLMQPASWRFKGSSALSSHRNAALVAIAATTRIGPTYAVAFGLNAWRAGEIEVPAWLGLNRPLFLPVVMKAVERMIRKRPKGAGDTLFVTEKGAPLVPGDVHQSVRIMGRQCGEAWHYDLFERLFQYHDRCFDGVDDRAAVAALARQRLAPDARLATRAIEEAAADEQRLRDALEQHPLAEKARELLGKRGMEATAKGQRNVFRAEHHVPVLSETVKNDPICAKLIATPWGKTGQFKLRLRLRDAHFPHVERMRRDGKIRSEEMQYLFKTSVRTLKRWRIALRDRERTQSEKAEDERWKAEVIRQFATSADGESQQSFFERLAEDPTFPFDLNWVMGVLLGAHLLGGTRRH